METLLRARRLPTVHLRGRRACSTVPQMAGLGPFLRLVFRPWAEGLENIPETGPAILASNHLSFSDSIFLPLVVPRRITFPAKAEYFTGSGVKGRLTAVFMRGISSHRPQRRPGRQAAMRAGLKLLRRGELFGIYPEGNPLPGWAALPRQDRSCATGARGRGTGHPRRDDRHRPSPAAWPGVPRILRPGVRIGKPLDFSRYAGMESDRFVLRSITDEIMYALMTLSGKEYVDIYASLGQDEDRRSEGRGAR